MKLNKKDNKIYSEINYWINKEKDIFKDKNNYEIFEDNSDYYFVINAEWIKLFWGKNFVNKKIDNKNWIDLIINNKITSNDFRLFNKFFYFYLFIKYNGFPFLIINKNDIKFENPFNLFCINKIDLNYEKKFQEILDKSNTLDKFIFLNKMYKKFKNNYKMSKTFSNNIPKDIKIKYDSNLYEKIYKFIEKKNNFSSKFLITKETKFFNINLNNFQITETFNTNSRSNIRSDISSIKKKSRFLTYKEINLNWMFSKFNEWKKYNFKKMPFFKKFNSFYNTLFQSILYLEEINYLIIDLKIIKSKFIKYYKKIIENFNKSEIQNINIFLKKFENLKNLNLKNFLKYILNEFIKEIWLKNKIDKDIKDFKFIEINKYVNPLDFVIKDVLEYSLRCYYNCLECKNLFKIFKNKLFINIKEFKFDNIQKNIENTFKIKKKNIYCKNCDNKTYQKLEKYIIKFPLYIFIIINEEENNKYFYQNILNLKKISIQEKDIFYNFHSGIILESNKEYSYINYSKNNCIFLRNNEYFEVPSSKNFNENLKLAIYKLNSF